jgi:hypothetical protein
MKDCSSWRLEKSSAENLLFRQFVSNQTKGVLWRKALESDVGIAGRRYSQGDATAWLASRRFPSRDRRKKTD